ncbi:glycosyltransferase family 4 protein [Paenibacillus provencensis]|uniref:Glycosyltransferase family 4 protein n=1 Tax=Paenibacillus provencensis TaxID=441151 RepID=A0ABW3PXJ6_9BACL|nr:glycosyltransferase family 1 protein [Paenibacillus sp. MER 78]MCM3130276.1 glycosyltransferase family 1 protein [Paenibacillus sp. MER 78]
MRIAIFTDTFLPEVNGVANTLGKWVEYLRARSIPVLVFAPQHGSLLNTEGGHVERFFSLPLIFYPECKLALPGRMRTERILHNFQPTLIHVATPAALGLLGAGYAAKHGVPLVASYHTHFDQYLKHYKLAWMEQALWKYMQWFHRNCERIYAPSESTKLKLEEKGMKQVEIWSRGIDAQQFRPVVSAEERASLLRNRGLDPELTYMLYVGRLAPEKNIEHLINSYASLPSRILDKSRLLIAGDGPLYGLSPSISHSLTEEHIKWLGYLRGNELRDIYALSDLFVFPSSTETFGNVILEAMASGLPVIAASAGGVLDIIEHEKTGILCPPEDHSSIVNSIIRLYDHPELSKSLAEAGRKYSLERSWVPIFDHLLSSYDEVIVEFNSKEDMSRPPQKKVK